MGRVRVKMNPNLERELQQMVQENVQPYVNIETQKIIREVRDRLEKQPADVVYAELVKRLRDHFGAGFEPKKAELQKVAAAIGASDLTG